jgi:hypothetical protein
MPYYKTELESGHTLHFSKEDDNSARNHAITYLEKVKELYPNQDPPKLFIDRGNEDQQDYREIPMNNQPQQSTPTPNHTNSPSDTLPTN